MCTQEELKEETGEKIRGMREEFWETVEYQGCVKTKKKRIS